MKRAAIYARYSTDLQSPTSVDDQVALCRRHAQRSAWNIVATYEEPAVSGFAAGNRPVYQAMVADALAGRFDVILVEDLSRLTRDTVELLSLHRRLEAADVVIVGVSDGVTTGAAGNGAKINLTIRGLVNDLYLDDLRAKTHRGQTGAVERGCSAGGRTFGYRVRRDPDGNRLQIDEAEAEIVRRIFREYSNGRSLRAITYALNAERVPYPAKDTKRGPERRGWAMASVRFMIRNEKYAGLWIWNRTRFVKDPVTGRRRPRPRPEREWIRQRFPELRIVAEELWDAVQVRVGELSRGQAFTRPAYSPYPLTGLLRCGTCGARMSAQTQTKRLDGRIYRVGWYTCTFARTKGPDVCSHATPYRRDVLEHVVAEQIRGLMDPPRVETLTALVNERAAARCAAATPRLGEVEAAITATRREAQGLMAFLNGGDSRFVREKLADLERQLAGLEDERRALKAEADAPPPVVLPAWVLGELEQIELHLRTNPVRAKAAIAKHLENGELRISPLPGKAREAEISGILLPTGLLGADRSAIGYCGDSLRPIPATPLGGVTFRFRFTLPPARGSGRAA